MAEYNSARQISGYIAHQLATFDDDEFVRFFIKNTEIYNPHKNDMELYRQLIKSAFVNCITEFTNITADENSEPLAEVSAIKDIYIRTVLSAVCEMFKEDIQQEKLTHWETRNCSIFWYYHMPLIFSRQRRTL